MCWAAAVAIKKLKNANIIRLRFMMFDDLNDIISYFSSGLRRGWG
jgi:hypothetical protein